MSVIKGKGDLGGRQIGSELSQIRRDHSERYFFASTVIRNPSVPTVMDVACGVGYGAKIMSDTGAVVLAFDISPLANAAASK